MEKLKIIFIVPAKNESKSIFKLVKKLKKYSKVLVVNDNSSDDTEPQAKSAGALLIRTKSKKSSYQNAIYEGLKYTKLKNYDFAITCDADNQHKMKDIIKVLKECNREINLIHTRRRNISRNVEKIFNFFFNLVWSIKDPLSGLKGYNLRKIKKSFFENNSETLSTSILVWLKKSDFTKMKEIHIYTNKRSGKSNFSTINLTLILVLSFINNLFISFK